MYLKYFILFLAVCSVKTALLGQNSQLRPYTIADGLPQSQITDLAQDNLGYLWVATKGGGVCRFDGVNFKVWNQQQDIGSNFINAVTFTRDSLFIGTRKGLSIKKDKDFVVIEGPEIYAIYEFESQLYFATAKGLFTYQKGVLKQYPIDAEIDQNKVNDLIFDGKYYWIATNKGLCRLDSLTGARKEAQKITANNFVALTYANSQVYAATYDDGTLVFDPNGNHHDPILIREPLRVTDMALVGEDELWIATDNNGITILDTQTYAEKGQIDEKNGLQVQNVYKIVTDVHDSTWITTMGGGFYKYFQNNFTHYDRNAGLQSNRIQAVYSDNGNVWFATAGAKLGYIDSSSEVHQILVPSYFSESKITDLIKDTQDRLWISTDNRGLMLRATKEHYDFQEDSTYVNSAIGYQKTVDTLVQKITKNYIIDSSKGLFSDQITALAQGNDGAIWAASATDGIRCFTYDVVKDSVVTLHKFGRKEGLLSKISVLEKDPSGTLWYASELGEMGRIQKGVLTTLNSIPEKYRINALCFNKDVVFVGTATNGIWWAWRNDLQGFQRLDSKKFSYSNTIQQLVFEDQGTLWAGTINGLDKIEITPSNSIMEITHYDKEDGFLGVETIPNAVAKDSKGALWFGANYGLTKYEPGEFMQQENIGKLHFEDLQIGYESLDTLQLKNWTNSEKVLQLASSQTQLSFVYKMVAIVHPKSVQYRFKLNDGEWSPWRMENRQNFSGLRYGKHQFQVQARNFRGLESMPIRFQFSIATPWYKKAWFPWAIAGGVVAFLGFMGWSYIKRIKKRNREAQKQLQLQNEVLALEQKALQLQMNPHFIFNVLNGIKAMGVSDTQKMNTTIHTFATLLRETLYNSRKEKITLDQEIKTLRKYIEVEQLMTDKDFTYSIHTDLEVDAEEILMPPMLVQPFVENAIRHGILKGQDAGVLQLNFYTQDVFLYGEIVDNGMGVFASQETKEKTDHQSVALKVTKERLEAISGKGALQLHELKKEDQTITGTKVVFKLPLETDF